ncbi:hypothetical protein [Virgisporangium aliadipatigenens]|nr:hypothetical protein [Virgisporangium aliadipatigenens]
MSEEDLVRALDNELGHSLPHRFSVGSVSVATGVAVLSHGDRFVNVFENDGSFLLSFHWRGRQQAHGMTSEISAAADSARRWVEGASLENLAVAYPFVKFSGLQLAYERGTAVEFQWAALLDLVKEEEQTFRDLVVLASNNDFLKQFFPHLGHRFALSFDEYSDGILVAVFVRRPGWFVIFGDGDDDGVRFEGDAPRIVDYLVARLRDQISR